MVVVMSFYHRLDIWLQICSPHLYVVRRRTCGDIHPCAAQLQLRSVCSHLRIEKGVTYLDSDMRGMLKGGGGPAYELASSLLFQLWLCVEFSAPPPRLPIACNHSNERILEELEASG